MVDIRFSKNFRLSEFVRSSTATSKGIDNTPSDTVVLNLYCLVYNVIQPLRDWCGESVTISSGYRCAKLNKAVGGVSNSQHMTGEAADIHIPDVKTGKRWFEYLKHFTSYDQLIWEHDKNGVYWIHVSCRRDTSKNRKQVINELLKK